MGMICDYCSAPASDCCSEWDGHEKHYEHSHACSGCGKSSWRQRGYEGSGHNVIESELESLVNKVKGGRNDQ